MTHPFPLDDVPEDVVKHLAAELGIAKPRLIAASETRLPTGEIARLVSAADPEKPNSVAHVTVSEAGVDPAARGLERLLGGGKLFVPEFAPGREVPPVPKEPVTIDPTTNDWRLNRCERVTEKITVTVPKSSAPPKADVYLLADTTGSMGSVLASVAAGASAILNNPALAGFDVAWGVGNYRDFPVDGGIHNSFAFAHQVSPTTTLPVADAAISAWVAGEGADGPEGQLYALHQIATDAGIGWRPDARRILVWFGDAPGHDPIPTALSGLASRHHRGDRDRRPRGRRASRSSRSAPRPASPPRSTTTPTPRRSTTRRRCPRAPPARRHGSPPRHRADRTRRASTRATSCRPCRTSSPTPSRRSARSRWFRPETRRSSSSRSPRRATARSPAMRSTC